MPDKIKAGYKTSEFWIALVAMITPIVVHLGFLTPGEAAVVNETATGFFTELFDLIGIVVPTAYVLGRAYLKRG